MNLKTDIQIGFPLATEQWEFVLVKSTNLSDSWQGWLSAGGTGPHANKVDIHTIGAGIVKRFNNHFTAKKGFRFFHVAEDQKGHSPAQWDEQSDTAACTLALAQPDVSNYAPIILVSCGCDFSPEVGLSGALLCPVSDSASPRANGSALSQKWMSALQRQESIVGLVLFDSDATLLVKWLKENGDKIPQIIAINDLDVMQLLTLPRSWPVLITVGKGDLSELAERLGIDGTPFRPTNDGCQPPLLPPQKWQIRKQGDPSLSLSLFEKTIQTLLSLRMIKFVSLLVALGCLSVLGVHWFLHTEEDRPVVMVDLSTTTPPHDLLRPIVDLADAPQPPRDLAPVLPRVDLASQSAKHLPPGTIRQIGGCDMVLIGADVMPPGLAPFWIDRTEVTTEAFEKCVDAGKCNFDTANLNAGAGGFCNRGLSRAQHPMNCVTFDEAANYCAQLGKTLPSAAQWDFAARGDTGRLFPWGETLPDGDALCWKRLSGTCPVEQHPLDKNPFGVVGMGANVAEWTETKFYPGNPSRSARVFRGWSWGTGTEQITERFGTPHGLQADKGQNNLGLRCVKPFSDTDER